MKKIKIIFLLFFLIFSFFIVPVNADVQEEFCTVNVYCTTTATAHALRIYHNRGTVTVNGQDIPNPVNGYSVVVAKTSPIYIQYIGPDKTIDLELVPINYKLTAELTQELYCCIDLIGKSMVVAGKVSGFDYLGYSVTIGFQNMNTGYDQHNDIYLTGGLLPFMGELPLADGDNSFRAYAQWETIYAEWNNALQVNFQ